MVLRTGRRDHARSSGLGELDDGAPDASRAAFHDDRLPQAHLRLAEQAQVRSAGVVQDRDGCHRIDPAREVVGTLGRGKDELREGSLSPCMSQAVGPHPVTHGELRDSTTEGNHDAHHIPAQNERKRGGRGVSP